MLPSPEIFDPGRTHCPSCNATQAQPGNRCGFCGFTAQLCVRRYPFEPPELSRFIDPDDALGAADRRRLQRATRKFEKRFPQVSVSVCIMTLPKGVDGREFGYWFFNRSPVRTREEKEQRKYGLLLIVDRREETVSVTLGYGLDCFMDDLFLSRAFAKSEAAFQRRGFAFGIQKWLRVVTADLIPICEEANYAFERWMRHHSQSSEDQMESVPAISEGYREVIDPPDSIPVKQLPRSTPLRHES